MEHKVHDSLRTPGLHCILERCEEECRQNLEVRQERELNERKKRARDERKRTEDERA